MNTVKSFVMDTEGQDLIEYGLLVGLITVLAVAAITSIGTKVATFFTTLKTDIGA